MRESTLCLMVPPTRRTVLQALGITGVASLAGCPSLSTNNDYAEQPPDSLGTTWSSPASEWRYPRRGLHNTARSSISFQEQSTVDWQANEQSTAEGAQESTHLAVATRETVILGTENENGLNLTAYYATDGTRRWSRQLRASDQLYPQFGGLVDGTLYLTDYETDVIAVDVSEGTVRWRVNLYKRVADDVPEQYLTKPNTSPERFAPVPAATPSCVYVQTSYGLHGLAPEDGRERWRLYLGDELEDDRILQDPGGLAVTDRRVLMSYARPEQLLIGVREHDGEPVVDRTSVPVQYPNLPLVTEDGTTVLDSGIIWSTDASGTLATGAASTRSVRWQFEGLASTGAAAFSSLAYDGTRVFVCEGHEKPAEFVVFALRAETGGLEWIYRESISDRGMALSADADLRVGHPAVADGTLLAGYGKRSEQGSNVGTLIALSTTEGSLRWRTGFSVAPRNIAPTESGIYISGHRSGITRLTATD